MTSRPRIASQARDGFPNHSRALREDDFRAEDNFSAEDDGVFRGYEEFSEEDARIGEDPQDAPLADDIRRREDEEDSGVYLAEDPFESETPEDEDFADGAWADDRFGDDDFGDDGFECGDFRDDDFEGARPEEILRPTPRRRTPRISPPAGWMDTGR